MLPEHYLAQLEETTDFKRLNSQKDLSKTQKQHLEQRLALTHQELRAARSTGAGPAHTRVVQYSVKTQSQCTYSALRGCKQGRFDYLQKGEDGAWHE